MFLMASCNAELRMLSSHSTTVSSSSLMSSQTIIKAAATPPDASSPSLIKDSWTISTFASENCCRTKSMIRTKAPFNKMASKLIQFSGRTFFKCPSSPSPSSSSVSSFALGNSMLSHSIYNTKNINLLNQSKM